MNKLQDVRVLVLVVHHRVRPPWIRISCSPSSTVPTGAPPSGTLTNATNKNDINTVTTVTKNIVRGNTATVFIYIKPYNAGPAICELARAVYTPPPRNVNHTHHKACTTLSAPNSFPLSVPPLRLYIASATLCTVGPNPALNEPISEHIVNAHGVGTSAMKV